MTSDIFSSDFEKIPSFQATQPAATGGEFQKPSQYGPMAEIDPDLTIFSNVGFPQVNIKVVISQGKALLRTRNGIKV